MRSSLGFIARFVVLPGRRDDALAVLDEMIDHVGSEPGTLVYLVHTDRDEPDVIWCYERYAHEEALREHQQSPLHEAIVPRLRALLTPETRIHWTELRGGTGLATSTDEGQA
jgi:quinol monooxygenase YgiN